MSESGVEGERVGAEEDGNRATDSQDGTGRSSTEAGARGKETTAGYGAGGVTHNVRAIKKASVALLFRQNPYFYSITFQCTLELYLYILASILYTCTYTAPNVFIFMKLLLNNRHATELQ